MQLTQNFSLKEFTKTSVKANNTPPQEFIPRLISVAKTLEVVRSVCGDRKIIVTSAYRSPAVNAAVGGSPTSAHAKGLAVDFIVEGLTNMEVCKLIVNSGTIYFDQLIKEKSGKNEWTHLGLSLTKPRQQILTYLNGKYYAGLV